MGLHAIDIRTNNIEPVFVRDDDGIIPIIREIMFANQSEIWIGTENGVYIYDIASDKLLSHLTHNYFDKYSLSDDAIYSLMQDREGGIWIGSYFGGADYLSSTKLSFTKYNRENTPTVFQVKEFGNYALMSRTLSLSGQKIMACHASTHPTASSPVFPASTARIYMDYVWMEAIYGLAHLPMASLSKT